MNHAVSALASAHLDFHIDARIPPEQHSWDLFLNLAACRNQIPIKEV